MIRKKQMTREVVIDLAGPEGNAFCLMGYAKNFAKQLDYTPSDTESMLHDMRSADYEHLIDVFDKHFGEFVILER